MPTVGMVLVRVGHGRPCLLAPACAQNYGCCDGTTPGTVPKLFNYQMVALSGRHCSLLVVVHCWQRVLCCIVGVHCEGPVLLSKHLEGHRGVYNGT